jgi:hypothetical protein
MAASSAQAEESKPWTYAFIILLLVSIWMLTMRLMHDSFLALDFEIALVYFPTALAGIIAFQTVRKEERSGN